MPGSFCWPLLVPCPRFSSCSRSPGAGCYGLCQRPVFPLVLFELGQRGGTNGRWCGGRTGKRVRLGPIPPPPPCWVTVASGNGCVPFSKAWLLCSRLPPALSGVHIRPFPCPWGQRGEHNFPLLLALGTSPTLAEFLQPAHTLQMALH